MIERKQGSSSPRLLLLVRGPSRLLHPQPCWIWCLGSSTRRITAMVRRYWYLLKGSWPRILELAYWPTMQVLLWGFVTKFFMTQSAWLAAAGGGGAK